MSNDAIYLYVSTNPQWRFEVYDYRGIFRGYIGRKKNIVQIQTQE